ncbi:MAG: YceD family protein [Microbacter sp.]
MYPNADIFIYLCMIFIGQKIVGKFEAYSIPLRLITSGSQSFAFHLTQEYFQKIDSPEVQKGDLEANILVTKNKNGYELFFDIQGNIIIPCDRCLDDMEQNIVVKEKLMVKFGKTFSDNGIDVVIVPEDEGEINVAWFLYEFIVLAIPLKHVHPFGKCNKQMTNQLRKHSASSSREEGTDNEEESQDDMSDFSSGSKAHDARWDKLNELIDND